MNEVALAQPETLTPSSAVPTSEPARTLEGVCIWCDEVRGDCKECGNPFIATGSKRFSQVFCSQICRKTYYYREKRKRNRTGEFAPVSSCIQCGSNIENNKKGKRFCCKKCKQKYHNIRRPHIERISHSDTCETCGKPFTITQKHLIGKKRFCSMRCQIKPHSRKAVAKKRAKAAHIRNEARLTWKCVVCGTGWPHGRKFVIGATYCSKHCSDERDNIRKKHKTKVVLEQRAKVWKCSVCGGPYLGHISKITIAKYCSNSCRHKAKLLTPHGLLTHYARSRIKYALKRQGLVKSKTTEDLLGCPLPVFVEHIKSQLAPGMNFENYGEWHVDHIQPCASFDLSNPWQLKMCFHYTNLQPLWAKDNLSKKDKIVEPQLSLPI